MCVCVRAVNKEPQQRIRETNTLALLSSLQLDSSAITYVIFAP